MQKQAPSIPRILTMVLFALSCFGLLLFLWLSFGGAIPLKPEGYRFKIAVPEAAQLGLEADVRVAGVRVGKVRQKQLDPAGNRTLAIIEVDPRFAPIKQDAKAILRQKTLLGETYLELTPGTKGAKNVPEGGVLANAQVQPSVQLDEIFTAFDEQTRQAFRTWQQDLAVSFRGHGQDFSDALGNLPTFASDANRAVQLLQQESAPLSRMFRDAGSVFAAITQDEGALRGLILNSAQVFRATAAQNEKLAETFQVFPVFLDESRLTLARLRTFSLNTRPLVQDLRPVARDLSPTLADLRALSPDLKQTFVSLDPLIDVSRKGLPALNETLEGAKPLLAATTPFLEELNPILQWLALYQKMVAGFIGNAAGGLAAKVVSGDPRGVGHYLRQISPNGIENLGIFPNRDAANRGNTYLDPLALAENRTSKHLIFPNWDCAPSGGEVEKSPPPPDTSNEHPPAPPHMGTIACFVQGPIPYKSNDRLFPHINQNHYGD